MADRLVWEERHLFEEELSERGVPGAAQTPMWASGVRVLPEPIPEGAWRRADESVDVVAAMARGDPLSAKSGGGGARTRGGPYPQPTAATEILVAPALSRLAPAWIGPVAWAAQAGVPRLAVEVPQPAMGPAPEAPRVGLEPALA